MKKAIVNVRASNRIACGFTLVELLVVIGIITVLSALLLPGLKKMREHGRRAVCVSNLQQTGVGLQLYAANHGGFLPTWWGGADPRVIRVYDTQPSYGSQNRWESVSALFYSEEELQKLRAGTLAEDAVVRGQYVGTRYIFHCPSRARPAAPAAGWAPGNWDSSAHCCSQDYCYRAASNTGPPPFFNAINVLRQDEYMAAEPPGGIGKRRGVAVQMDSWWGTWESQPDLPWHGDGYNVLWLDGTVSWVDDRDRGIRAYGDTGNMWGWSEIDSRR